MATSKSAASALFRVLALVLCLGAGLSSGTSPSVAAELTAADKRLFDAVWANDMAAVRRVLAEGADPAVADESGMSAVDVAVDRGYFEIAHYLLAVQNQRRYATGNAAPVTPPPAARPAQPQPAPAPAPAPVVVAAPIEASPAAPVGPAQPSARQNVVVDPELPDFLTEEKVEFINPDDFLMAGTADPAAPSPAVSPAASPAAEPITAGTGSGEPVELPAAPVQPAPQPTALPPAEAETPNLFQRFTNLFESDVEQTVMGTETKDRQAAPLPEATAPARKPPWSGANPPP